MYLTSLGLRKVTVKEISSWDEAKSISSHEGWSREWWRQEDEKRQFFYKKACLKYGEDAVLRKMNVLTHAMIDNLFLEAEKAAKKSEVEDKGLVRSAAGAAAQVCYCYGLELLTASKKRSVFASKIELFKSGHWPLCLIDEKFFVF